MPAKRWKGHMPWNWTTGRGGVWDWRAVVMICWQV
jgi:hypothetical protein